MAAPPPTFSLAALFGAQPPDPHLSLYEAASRPYLIDAAPATPTSVRAQLASASNLRHPTSILILDNTGKLRVISLLFQKQQGYGLPPDVAVDDKYYGWDSEFIMGNGILVEVLPTTFNQTTTDVLVPTMAGILTALATDNDPDLQLGPFNVGDPDTEPLRTRNAVIIPSQYVGIILTHTDGMQPRAFFDEVYPLMQAEGTEAACLALTNFVRMAITISVAGGNPLVSITRPLPAPRNVNLLTHSSQHLQHYMSTLTGPLTPSFDLAPVLTHLTARQTADEARLNQAAAAKLAKEDNATQEWLGDDAFATLLQISMAIDVHGIASIWKKMASGNHRGRLAVLQGEYRNNMSTLGSNHSPDPWLPNMELLQQLSTAHWTVTNADELESGSAANPFKFGDSNTRQAQEHAMHHSLITSGGATATLADAKQLLTASVTIPTKEGSIRVILRMLALYMTVLPPGHPITAFMSIHYHAMKHFDPDWANYQTSIPGTTSLKGVYHLTWIMDRLTVYFRELQRGIHAQCPDPLEIINYIKLRKVWEPIISPTFIVKYKVAVILNFYGGTVPGTLGSGGTVATDMSTLTPITGAPPGTLTPGGPPLTINPLTTTGNTKVENPGFNSSLFGIYKSSATKCAEIRKKIKQDKIVRLPPSKVQADKDMCLAWHTKGICNTSCPCKADHINYTPTEYIPMVNWCRDHGYKQE